MIYYLKFAKLGKEKTIKEIDNLCLFKASLAKKKSLHVREMSCALCDSRNKQ